MPFCVRQPCSVISETGTSFSVCKIFFTKRLFRCGAGRTSHIIALSEAATKLSDMYCRGTGVADEKTIFARSSFRSRPALPALRDDCAYGRVLSGGRRAENRRGTFVSARNASHAGERAWFAPSSLGSLPPEILSGRKKLRVGFLAERFRSVPFGASFSRCARAFLFECPSPSETDSRLDFPPDRFLKSPFPN